ncbi:MAG: hypothetical protein AAF367_06400 [Pseudomonadota bacterium]
MRSLLKTVLTALAILGATQVQADLSTDTVRDLSIEDASATILANGDVRLRFILANDSPEPITVTGVSSPSARSGEIIGDSHHGTTFPVSGLILRPDEEMDFTTSHLKARLTGVADFKGVLVFQLLLDDGTVSGEAHVH